MTIKRRLGDIVKLSSGGTPSKNNPDYWGGDIPWISAKNMKDEFLSDSSLHITREGLNHGSRLAPEGSLLLLVRGSGLFNDIPICFVERDLAFNQDVKCIESVEPERIPNKYIFYWLKSQKYVLSQSVGVTTIGAGKFDTDYILNMEIPIPTIEIIKKQVSFIDAITQMIRFNTKINDNLLQQAQTIYREMFVNTSNDKRQTCRAEEYFDIAIGKTPPRKEHQWFTTDPSDVTWVSISDMGSCGTYIRRSSEQLTQEAVDKFNIRVIPSNTVLLSFKLTVGRIAITYGEMTTNEAIAHFKTDKPYINEYLYCYLKDFNYQTMGSTSSIATAVNSKIIKAMPFIVPTDDEISRFHAVAGPMFEQILNNQLENDSLAEMRDSLLPRLMSGELDVSELTL